MSHNIANWTQSETTARTARVLELTPLIDIYENEKEMLLLADLPSVAKDAVTIEVNHPELRIEARASGDEHTPDRVYRRTFRIDSTFDIPKVEAKLADGVLQVHLPKSEPYQVRKIDVKSS